MSNTADYLLVDQADANQLDWATALSRAERIEGAHAS